jgi:serine/threonine protein kinase
MLTPQGHIKLIDFGFAYKNVALANEQLVSFPYGAPEIFQGLPYDQSIDIWSLGVILFVMVCGDFPFGSDSPAGVAQRTQMREPVYPDSLSRDLRELLQMMFQKNPRERIDINGLKAHPWLRISRYALLMSDDLVASPAVRTIPLSQGELDATVLEVMKRKGVADELPFEDLLRGESEPVVMYRILRTTAVAKLLPSYCQSVLLQKGVLRPRGFKSRSVDLPKAIPVARADSEGSALAEKPLPPLAIMRPGVGRGAQLEVVRPVVATQRRPHSIRAPVFRTMTPEPRFAAGLPPRP